MTKTINRLALATTALFALGLGGTVASAAPVTKSAVAKAKVLKQLTLTKTGDMDFGTVVSGTAAGTVTIAADGTSSCDAILSCTGTRSAAVFNVTGSNNTTVKITLPVTAIKLVSTTNATDTMDATLVAPATVALANSGSTGVNFNVGGALTVKAGQADGIYQTNFDVTVDYQ